MRKHQPHFSPRALIIGFLCFSDKFLSQSKHSFTLIAFTTFFFALLSGFNEYKNILPFNYPEKPSARRNNRRKICQREKRAQKFVITRRTLTTSILITIWKYNFFPSLTPSDERRYGNQTDIFFSSS
jgi:hypothetical protein